MRVAQHHRAERLGIERKRAPVARFFRGTALNQPAVDQQLLAADADAVARAGDLLRRAVECDVQFASPIQRTSASRRSIVCCAWAR